MGKFFAQTAVPRLKIYVLGVGLNFKMDKRSAPNVAIKQVLMLVNPLISSLNSTKISSKKAMAAKKKKTIFIVIGVILAVAAVISYFVIQNSRATTYKENAKTFCSTVLSSATNLEDIGNEIQGELSDYIYDGWSIYDSIDEAVAGALSNKSEEVTKAKTEKIIIDGLYSKLKKPVNKSEEIEELCKAVKVLYDEYGEFYDIVTEPSGNYNTFQSNFGDSDSATVDAYEDLNDLIEY